MSVRIRILATVLLLIALPWAIYAPARHGPFVFDDRTGVLEVTASHGHEALGQSLKFWGGGRTSYRPLRYASFWMDWRAGGGTSEAFHRTNTLLHCVNGLLMLWLLRRLRVPVGLAAAAALLFCVHPIQTQAVAYISGRKDLLGAVFYLLALHASLRGSRARGPTGRLLGGGLFCVAAAAAFQAKEIALTLPAAALLLDAADFERTGGMSPLARLSGSLRRRPVFYGLMALAGAGGLFIKLVVKPGTKVPFSPSDLLANLPLAGQTLAWHARKLLWPWPHLADTRGLFPARPEMPGVPPAGFGQFWNGGDLWATLVGLALFAVLTAWALRSRRRGPALGGLLFLLLALAPTLNLVRLNEPAAEHYLYLPLAGGALMLAALAASALDVLRAHGTVRRLLPALLLAALACAAWSRASAWNDRERLWTDVLRVNPTNARAWSDLGLLRFEAGDRAAARDHFRRALRLEPGLSRAAANLMALLEGDGELAGALAIGETALATRPDDPLLLSYRGRLLLRTGRADEARPLLDRVADLKDGPELAVDSWAVDRCLSRHMTGDTDEAVDCLRDAAAARPGDPLPLSNLGMVLLDAGRFEEAAEVLERAVALPGASPTAHRNLAMALYRLGRHEEALARLERARTLGDVVSASLEAALREALEVGHD